MNKSIFIRPIFTAALAVTIALLSCSSGGDGTGNGNGNGGSSGSVEYAFCVFVQEKICLNGPMTVCQGGVLSNSCPYPSSSLEQSSSSSKGNSSSAGVSSSSMASSSSLVVSSSSDMPSSSSSIMQSSNSAKLSSSSPLVVSSSSNVPSSSSFFTQINSSSSVGGIIYGSVYHSGQTYKTVVIGTQTWMAENLNYNAPRSKCYGEDGQDYNPETSKSVTLSSSEIQANCAKYGRLYDWAAAMGISSYYNNEIYDYDKMIRGICPSGWHLPNNAEWNILMKFVDPTCIGFDGFKYDFYGPCFCTKTGTKLKATTGWNPPYAGVPVGTDNFGFSALPGGYAAPVAGWFVAIGDAGEWWSATNEGAQEAYSLSMDIGGEHVSYSKYSHKSAILHSVRCLKD